MNVLKWRQQIQQDLHKSLNLNHSGFAKYCEFYGLTQLNCQVEIVKLNKESVIWHFYQTPLSNKGYALVTHGLFDHSAYMKPLIKSLLAKGLNVVAQELPGHGLDEKAPLECEGFEEYTRVNKLAHQWMEDHCYKLLVEVAHSTGAVGSMNKLLSGYRPAHKMIFLNPLVKISMFDLAKLSHGLLSRFLTNFPRKKWGRGEDKNFLEFRSRDPLQSWVIPKKWARHYFDWADKLLNTGAIGLGDQLLVITGGKDHVVNHKESEKILNMLFNQARFSHYKNLGHQMLYGDERDVQELLNEINHWWSCAGPGNFE